MADHKHPMSLDVDAPDKVVQVLRFAAQQFRESESELAIAWQDKNAGKVWAKIAKILERAAIDVENMLELQK